SSSAKGAIALRQSCARSWSISRSRVLSDWTIRGPSFTWRVYGVGQIHRPGGAGSRSAGNTLIDRGGCGAARGVGSAGGARGVLGAGAWGVDPRPGGGRAGRVEGRGQQVVP